MSDSRSWPLITIEGPRRMVFVSLRPAGQVFNVAEAALSGAAGPRFSLPVALVAVLVTSDGLPLETVDMNRQASADGAAQYPVLFRSVPQNPTILLSRRAVGRDVGAIFLLALPLSGRDQLPEGVEFGMEAPELPGRIPMSSGRGRGVVLARFVPVANGWEVAVINQLTMEPRILGPYM